MASPYLQRQKLPFLEDGFFIDYQALQCYHLSGRGSPSIWESRPASPLSKERDFSCPSNLSFSFPFPLALSFPFLLTFRKAADTKAVEKVTKTVFSKIDFKALSSPRMENYTTFGVTPRLKR